MANQATQTVDPFAEIATPIQPAASASASASSDPFASIATPIPASAATPAPPSMGQEALEGVKQSGLGQMVDAVSKIYQSAKQAMADGTPLIDPPKSPTEHLIYSIGGLGTGGGLASLEAWRAANNIVAMGKNALQASAPNYPQAIADFHQALNDFHQRSLKSAALSAVKAASDAVPAGRQIGDIAEGAREGNWVTPTVRSGVDAATALAGGVGAEAMTPEAIAARTAEQAENPGWVQQVLKGKDVAQTPARIAMRDNPWAAARDAQTPLRATLDRPISLVHDTMKSTYGMVDRAAGTDLKSIYDGLDNVEFNIHRAAPGSQDEALWEAKRTDLMNRLDDAKASIAQTMGPKGLDLYAQAKNLYTREQALKELQVKVFKNPSIVQGNDVMGTPETVNVDSAVKALQKMQDNTKYGAPRLEQALGKQGAQDFLNNMYAAQRSGVAALPKATIARTIGRYVGRGALMATGGAVVGGLAYEALR